LFVSWFVYAAFLAALGLWFSTRSRTTLRATTATLVTAGMLGGGHWVLSFLCLAAGTVAGPGGVRGEFGEVFKFLLYGMTPPAALAWLAFHGDILGFWHLLSVSSWHEDPWEAFLSLVIGLVVWAFGACWFWWLASAAFRRLSNRGRHRRRPSQKARKPRQMARGPQPV
jgi:hypothetical protein